LGKPCRIQLDEDKITSDRLIIAVGTTQDLAVQIWVAEVPSIGLTQL
jgi:hypothetical protein